MIVDVMARPPTSARSGARTHPRPPRRRRLRGRAAFGLLAALGPALAACDAAEAPFGTGSPPGITGTTLAPAPSADPPLLPYAVAAPGPLPRGRAIGASPAPWMDFCRRTGARGRCAAPEARVALTAERWDQLVTYQRRINRGVVQRPDPVGVGDHWRLLDPGQAGDCEDIALTKRDALIDEGWPAGALQPAICYAHNQPVGGRELHLVLTAETDAGTFVLGNLTDEVRPWQDSDCAAWVMRGGSNGWHWIAGGIGVPIRPAGR